MYKNNLINYGVVELSQRETRETNGGFWAQLGLAVAVAIIADWDNFKKGLNDGWNAAN